MEILDLLLVRKAKVRNGETREICESFIDFGSDHKLTSFVPPNQRFLCPNNGFERERGR